MKIKAESLPPRQVVLNVEAEPQEVEESLEKAYRRLVQKTVIPGFRKGKAPRHMLERYLGRGSLLEEALNHLLPEMADRAVKEQALEAISNPQLELVGVDPVVFKATVPLRPTVELGDYRSVRLEPEKVEITDEQVKAALEDLRYSQAPWEPAERPVQFDDLVTLDAEAHQGETQIMNEKGSTFIVRSGISVPLPGFAEQLVGMEREQVKEFELSFPADDQRTQLAGKSFYVEVKVQEIKEKRLAQLDDDFAKGVGEGFESLEQLRERITANLRASAEAAARTRFEQQVLDEVIKGVSIEYPPVMVEHEVEHLLEERLEPLRGRVGVDQYLRMLGKTEEELRNELRPAAEERIRRSLVLAKVIEVEAINVTDEVVDAEIEAMSKGPNGQDEELRKIFSSPEARDNIRRNMVTRKAIGRLAETARGEALPSASSETGSQESAADESVKAEG